MLKEDEFKPGEIARYSDGITSLVRLGQKDTNGSWYCGHVLGGSVYILESKLSRPTGADLAYCQEHRPEWFALIPFVKGDKVCKVGTYKAPGEVRAVFTLSDDDPSPRYVVVHKAEGGGLFAHIYGAQNLIPGKKD